jgi:two-component system, sensor histidine kinase LadS
MTTFKNVISVDDVKSNLYVLHKVLEKMCPEVVIHDCESGEEGINVYNSMIKNNYPIDLIVCDYHMPWMDGARFAKEIRELGYKGKLVILTSDVTVENGAIPFTDAVIYKPLKIEDIQKTLLYEMCIDCMKCLNTEENT